MLRRVRLARVAAAATLAGAVPALANVTISTAATQNMTCSAGVCAPTAAGAVLNVRDLEALLASGNVKVTTTGAAVQATNIRVDAQLAWSSTSTLALDAYKSIMVDGPVSVSGAGGLSLATNDGGTAGEFVCGEKGRLKFAHLSNALSIDGTAYTLVGSVAALAGAIAVNPSGDFALAKSYDAGRDGTYATAPIPTVFSGRFNGLGNTLSNLTINDPIDNSFVALFAEIVTGATLTNVRLVNENVTGASGTSQDSSTEFIGGLVGYGDGGTITESSVTGAAAGGIYAPIGGLVGTMHGTVKASWAAVSVSGGSGSPAGGLIGITNNASIADSHATGDVSGSSFVGGLVGFQNGAVEHSFATGNVTDVDASTDAGGLAGINQSGTIGASYATGVVTCVLACGGLVGVQGFGLSPPLIWQSFATGTVLGGEGGGLVGYNAVGAISDSYATGAVSAQVSGGLVGQNDNSGSGSHAIRRSYSTGIVTGDGGSTGGLIGYDQFASTTKRAYWDTTTSGITNPGQGTGNISNDPGIKGLSNTQLQSGLPKGFNSKIWSENPNVNGGLPYLLANPPGK